MLFLTYLVAHQVCFLICTVGHLFWHFIQGWLAAPLSFLLPFLGGRSSPRDSNPGCGDWRRSLLVLRVCLFLLFVFMGNI